MKGRISCWLKGTVGGGLRLALSGLRNLFFVRECAVCGAELDCGDASGDCVVPGGGVLGGGRFLCEKCLGDIPLTRFWMYSENAAMESLAGCRVHNAAALFFYRHDSPYCEIVRQFKYGQRESLGLWAARLLGGYLAEGGLYTDVQAVVPVPLHPFKRWKRGFNQAEIIARGVAEGLASRQTGAEEPAREAVSGTAFPLHSPKSGLGADDVPTQHHPGHIPPHHFGEDSEKIPVVPHLLRRRRYTSTQTRRSATSRRSNVSGAFAVNHRELERLRAAGITHILIVDDVLTTGATLSECIRLLQDHFTVSAATLGFVE